MHAKTLRLVKNRHGIYCLRLLVPKRLRAPGTKPKEVRISLKTRDPHQARLAALKVSLGLEQRLFEMNEIDTRSLIAPWTLKAGGMEVTVNSEEDAASFQKFLDDNPQVKAAFISAIESGADPVFTTKVFRQAMQHFAGVPAGVHAPTSLKTAFTKYLESRTSMASNTGGTVQEKAKTLELLTTFLTGQGRDPATMEVSSLRRPELMDFVADYAKRQGKTHTLSGQKKTQLSARTVQKLIGHLRDFFSYAVAQEWCASNFIDDQFDANFKSVKKKVAQSKDGDNYDPFTDEHIAAMFEPFFYLENNSAADYFWGPLIAAYTGMRLGEVAQIQMDAITQEEKTGVYLIQVGTKNANSFRQVPIPEKLIQIGLMKYVEKIRSLKQERLFPNRLQTPTEVQKPGKALGDSFAKHLDDVGVSHPKLVFHSFRHTIITRMHVLGVPLGDAELIVGHAAQDAAEKFGKNGGGHFNSKSVHHNTYTHPEAFAEADRTLFERLKRHLDNSIHYPIDLLRLQQAADVVLDHVVVKQAMGKSEIASGWHVNKKAYTAKMLQRLDPKNQQAN